MSYGERFLARPGHRLRLSEIDADFRDQHEHKDAAAGEIKAYAEKLRALQYLLYAEHRRSLLICLQVWMQPARTARSITCSVP